MEGAIQDIRHDKRQPAADAQIEGNQSSILAESEHSARLWFQRAAGRESTAPAEAIDAYRVAVTLNPAFVEAHHNLARLLRKVGRIEESVTHARLAVSLAETHPAIQLSLGLSLESAGDMDGAIGAYRAAIDVKPSYVQAHVNLGRALEAAGRSPEAAKVLRAAAEQFPKSPEITLNLAQTFLSLGNSEGAADLADKLIATGDFLPAAFNIRGAAHMIAKQTEKAIHAFTSAVRLEADFAGAHENLALALLQNRQFDRGWQEYEWRWQNPNNALTKVAFPWPRWDGSPLKGRTLLLHGEQGLGDVLQFIRFADLIDKQGGEVILACAPQLQRLLATAPGVDTVCNLGDTPSGVDYYLPMMSLPHILGAPGPEAWPKAPYLHGPEGNPAPRLLDPKAIRVGVCWAGRPKFQHDPSRNRSFPGKLLVQLLSLDNTQLVGFQRGPESACPALQSQDTGYADAGAAAADFFDDAAILMQMDLVITADTALAHLAGALAIPTWLLLPYVADWRWEQERTDTPWYPSMRLFRQPKPGDWQSVIDQVVKQLSATIDK